MLPYSNAHLPICLNVYTFTDLFIRFVGRFEMSINLIVARNLNESTFYSTHERSHFVGDRCAQDGRARSMQEDVCVCASVLCWSGPLGDAECEEMRGASDTDCNAISLPEQ